MALELSLSCLPSDRTYALYDGGVQPAGINLNVLPFGDDDPYWSWRKTRNHLFDVSEMSISNYLIQLDQGNTDLIALPVFLSRGFRHANLFVNPASGIHTPQDLKGKKVGMAFYDPTTPVWVRGFLQHQYGVSPSDIRWHLFELSLKGMSISLPADVKVTILSRQKPLDQWLVEGEIDALINAGQPPRLFQAGDPRIVPLFADFHEEELAFYRQFKLFPIIHTVVLKRHIHQQHPWVAQSLYDAFCQAKQAAPLSAMALDGHLKYTLPLLHAYVEETQAVFKRDPWIYGLSNNKPEIETLIRYCREQGLVKSGLSLEQAFIPDLNEALC
ncbi:ABC transporter substrate-binding protein [Ramlibacter sp. AW1]|uniref:ABC transporter substrate-binding protein n=1 Tax=Ramlibacter aurantiacus TaxID=2801330 RepID=A0A937D623_9BURK|nr:ABC transporter substrate-binding protein [Ramlibacter aurantiacus]MBL0421897.1 ABC transporter substrate-binding protein [Ramlibacter aurantiacus]